ncbi:hypothetical protein J2S41_001955 [Catenuloplanes atrovinosus]|uniref:Uncharacterized protein n=1 Tax=Catenuloplanes atrovinosus TaxID=137266 RepID=A0AAE3YMC9_9ACTN|nr:hypothetical protein [Catenuloplanes atrovinosus]
MLLRAVRRHLGRIGTLSTLNKAAIKVALNKFMMVEA